MLSFAKLKGIYAGYSFRPPLRIAFSGYARPRKLACVKGMESSHSLADPENPTLGVGRYQM
jgi:hypothetical protein